MIVSSYYFRMHVLLLILLFVPLLYSQGPDSVHLLHVYACYVLFNKYSIINTYRRTDTRPLYYAFLCCRGRRSERLDRTVAERPRDAPCPSRPVLNVLLTMRQGRSVHAVNSRRSCTVAGVWPSQICCTEWPSLFAEGTVWSWVHSAVDRLRAVAEYQLSPVDQFSTYCLVESRVPVNPGDDICGEISYKQRWWILSRFSIFNET